ncbi:MAG: NifB/NifX family molybdenum-iron cluster-binding protein [Thermosphaera sp.]
MKIGVPVVKVQEDYYVNPHFGRSRFFAIVESMKDGYSIKEVVENPSASHEHGRGDAVVSILHQKGVEAVLVAGLGPGAFARLRTLGMKIYAVPKAGEGLVRLKDALEMFSKGALREAEGPVEH